MQAVNLHPGDIHTGLSRQSKRPYPTLSSIVPLAHKRISNGDILGRGALLSVPGGTPALFINLM